MATYDKTLTTAQYRALLAGLPKYCPSMTLTLDGQTYTTADLVSLIGKLLDAQAAVPVAKAAWLAAIASIASLEAKEGQTLKEARQVVALMWKSNPEALAELGIELPRPRRRLSVEERALSTEKLRATRTARRTMSKKQKSKIFGDVTGVTITPTTAGGSEQGAP